MKLGEALEILFLLYTRPDRLYEELKKWCRFHKNQILWRYHIPLFLLIIPFLALSPFAFYASLFSWQYFIQPIAIIGISLLIANSHDYAAYYFASPVHKEEDDVSKQKSHDQILHISLISHLCIAGSFPFFFLHSGLGVAILLLNILYAQFLSVDIHARAYGKSRARIWGTLFLSIILLLIPILAVLMLINIWHNARYIFSLFF